MKLNNFNVHSVVFSFALACTLLLWPVLAIGKSANLVVVIEYQHQQVPLTHSDTSLYQQISELFITSTERIRLLQIAKNNSEKALKSLGYHRNNTESLLSKNIRSHLGDLPTSLAERDSYIYLAKQHSEQALQALGYYQADVDLSIDKRDKKLWQLVIHVELNQATRIKNVAIVIDGAAKNDQRFTELLENVEIKSGDILHHGKYEDLKNKLISLGLERGYFQGQLTQSNIAVHQSYQHADIIIHYSSGIRYRFGQVNFSEVALEPSLLNSLVPFEYGQNFTSKSLFKLQNQLQQSQYFSSAIAIPDKSDLSDENLPIKVALKPAKSHSFDFGLGYATDTEYRISAGWRTPLVNRWGHSQETKIEYSKINPTGRFNYSIPLSHPLNDVLQFQFEVNDDEYGDISSTYLNSKIANLRLYKRWSTQLYTRFLRERWSLSGATTEVEYTLPGISLSKTYRRGPQLDPTSGFSQLYTIEGGTESANSAIDVIRVYARWRYVTTLAPKHRLVVRSELGAAFIDDDKKDLLAPSLRFFAGGDQSIRGFAYQSLGSTELTTADDGTTQKVVVGGTRLAVGSLEYQYYFNKKFRGILFTDGGNALDEFDFKAVYSVGTGLHYLSPVGPIRVDLGYSLSEENPSWRLHITLGAEL